MLALVTGLAGDVWRYSIGWIGWGVVVTAIIVVCVVVLVRRRMPFRAIPLTVAVFLGWCLLTVIWSEYRIWTAAGWLLSTAAAAAGMFFATQLGREGLLRALAGAAQWIIGLSLAFEAFVAIFIRQKVLPFWTDYSNLDRIPNAYYWSRDLLFDGGRIQGIMGNSNLLAFAALLGLIAVLARWAGGEAPRIPSAVWTALAVITLVLTRSTTVIVCAVAAMGVLAVMLLARRLRHRGRIVLLSAAGLAAAAVVATIVAVPGPFLALFRKSATLTFRTQIWSDVIDLAVQRPVQGWGWITWWAPWIEPFRGLADYRGVVYMQAHEAWLDVWFQAGLVGVVLFGAVMVLTAAKHGRVALLAPAGASTAPLALLLILVVLVVQSLAESRLLIEGEFALLVALAVLAKPGFSEPVDSAARASPVVRAL